MPTEPARPFIVAEVSKNWTGEHEDFSGLLSEQFEQVVEVNRQRGYLLHSFQLHRLMTGPGTMNETIIAVFQRGELLSGELDEVRHA